MRRLLGGDEGRHDRVVRVARRRSGPPSLSAFCLVDYDADSQGRPLLVVVDGRDKPFRTTLADLSSTAFVEVFDGDAPSTDTLLYRAGSSVPPDSMTETRRLALAGHVWTLRVSAPGAALPMAHNSPSRGIGLR